MPEAPFGASALTGGQAGFHAHPARRLGGQRGSVKALGGSAPTACTPA